MPRPPRVRGGFFGKPQKLRGAQRRGPYGTRFWFSPRLVEKTIGFAPLGRVAVPYPSAAPKFR